MTGFLNRAFLTFFLVAVILSPILTVHSGICKEIRDNKALDEQVGKFLESRNGTWHDWNIPYSDGKVLYNLVLKNNYKKAVEVGTSTGLSAIWIAWALTIVFRKSS